MLKEYGSGCLQPGAARAERRAMMQFWADYIDKLRSGNAGPASLKSDD
jgi:hypothetical protein